MRWLLVIPALLPSWSLFCYLFLSHLPATWFATIIAALPLIVAALASAAPELMLLPLVPYFAIYQFFFLLFGKIRTTLIRPDLVYIQKGKVKKVAVIGGGSSGLVAAKEAMDAGLDVVVFEQTSELGGNWVFRETDAHSSVYRSTVINTTKQMNTFSDFPMPDDMPTYPHHRDIVKYFKAYAEKFGIAEKMRFNTRVLSVELIEGDRWKVASSATDSSDVGMPAQESAKIREDDDVLTSDGSQCTVEEFDAVLACNGHHHVPLWPEFAGQETFKGSMIHSHSYKDPTSCDKGFDYRGKRVLVVGVGNSGADIAVELSRVTEELHVATRSGLYVLPKYVNGVATDHAWRLSRLLSICIPNSVQSTRLFLDILSDIFEHKVNSVQGDAKSWGLRPQCRIAAAHPTLNQDILHRIGLGSITVHGNVGEIKEDGVVFEDGKFVQLDAIVFATGYLVRFPFLRKSLSPVQEGNHAKLHHFMLSTKHPQTLAYIGLLQPFGAIMPISELQCRWAMQIFKGERGVPKPEEMERQISERIEAIWRQFAKRDRHTLESEFFPIMEALAEEVGCVPRMWNPNNWKVLVELLLAPSGWPFTYRLQGPGKWDGAAHALKKAYSQMGKHP